MKSDLFRHFYVDCTNTYFNSGNGGIARVTRMLTKLGGIASEAGYGEVHPVVFCGDRHYILPACDIFRDSPFTEGAPVGKALRLWNKLLFIAFQGDAAKRIALRRYRKLKKAFPGVLRSMEETPLSMNDILVLPELFSEDRFPNLIDLKKRLKLVVLIHDLIPIMYPEYCIWHSGFNGLFRFAAKNADLVIAVSRYSASCFEAYEKFLEVGGVSLAKKKVAWFHPGSDLTDGSAPPTPSPEITKIFSEGTPVYLVCGTIEPRKNHLLVLRVFEQLWAEGQVVNLLFVGRYGWRAEQTRQEIIRHPELNKRFFWLSRASDGDLGYAYRHCHAVILPSQAEGFGLPLVEALACGRQVIFSRIKSFEEIVPAEFLINSFHPDKQEELLQLVRDTLLANDRLELDKFKPIAWSQAVKEFYRILAESPAA